MLGRKPPETIEESHRKGMYDFLALPLVTRGKKKKISLESDYE